MYKIFIGKRSGVRSFQFSRIYRRSITTKDTKSIEKLTPVTLNADLGEGFGIYKLGDDETLLHHISVANLACGFHASDYSIMAKTVRRAKELGVKIGAHPSLPDLHGFGRREIPILPEELKNCLIYQVGALSGFLKKENVELNHIKPHGALYGMAARDPRLAHAICEVAVIFGNVPIIGMAGTQHEFVAKEHGIPFLAEFFADLEYDSQGELLITREHPPCDPKKAVKRVKRALEKGKVQSCDGVDIPVVVDTVCLHSDTPGASELAMQLSLAVNQFNNKSKERKAMSAGFLILSGEKYLLGHSTVKKDDKNIKQFDDNWTIFKGLIEPGEAPLQAAVRELQEESGIDLNMKQFVSLKPSPTTKPYKIYKTGRGKSVEVFLIDDKEGLILNSGIQFNCTSLIDSPPPNLAHRKDAPEIDAFLWVTKEEAKKMVFNSQKELFN